MADMARLAKILSGAYLGDYATTDTQSGSFASPHSPLDAVEHVGTLRARDLLKGTHLRFGKGAILSIRNEDCFKNLLRVRDGGCTLRVDHRRGVSPKWIKHLLILRSFGLVSRAPAGAIIYTSGYFAVWKSDGKTARSIFNGKRLSENFVDPGPVNLLDIPELLELISDTTDAQSGMSMLLGDIRHCFHQYSVCAAARNIFGLRVGSQFFRWNCLPMGWSHSPRIAQCICYSLLLHTKKGESKLGAVTPEDAEHPPRYVPLIVDGQRKGFLTCLYDNIAVVTSCHKLASEWKTRIERNFRIFNVSLKNLHLFNQGELAGRRARGCEAPAAAEHLGITFGIVKVDGAWRARWRHNESKESRWRDVINLLQENSVSAKNIARAVGILVWDCLLRQCSMAAISDALKILSEVGKFVGGERRRWNSEFSLSTEQRDTLVTKLRMVVLTNKWIIGKRDKTDRKIIVCASDASDDFIAGVLMDSEESWSEPTNTNEIIFVREIRAAIVTICRAIESEDEAPTHVIVAVDNTAAVHVLRRGYSSHSVASNLVADLHRHLELKDSKLTVVPVRGIDNVADVPSRCGHSPRGWSTSDMAQFVQRAKNTLRTIDEHLQGNGKTEAVVNRFQFDGTNGTRHAEHDGTCPESVFADVAYADDATCDAQVPVEKSVERRPARITFPLGKR